MAKRKIYSFNGESLPDTFNIGGEEVTVTGIFIPYHPRAMFCKNCGYVTNANDRRENQPSFDGLVCPECGTIHTSKSVLYNWTYVNSMCSTMKLDYSSRKHEIKKTTIDYKLIAPGECLLSLEKLPEKVEYYPITALAERWATTKFKQELLDKYGNKLDPMVKLLLETEVVGKSSYASSYYGRLSQVQDIYDNYPTLLNNLLEAFRSDSSMRCERFESMYPEYLLPLTAQLIKDYNPVEERNRSWSKPYVWKPTSAYANYEALTCVVSYYKSGLISFSNMKTILEKTEAFKNPTFIPAFKANYLQFNNFLDDLIEEQRSLSSTIFDIKNYYIKKSKNYFIEQGYTPDQVQAALDSTKYGQYGLDFLNAIGSTRRKKK